MEAVLTIYLSKSSRHHSETSLTPSFTAKGPLVEISWPRNGNHAYNGRLGLWLRSSRLWLSQHQGDKVSTPWRAD